MPTELNFYPHGHTPTSLEPLTPHRRYPPGDDFYCTEIVTGRTPIVIVADTPGALAFHHTRPTHPVHIVVVPKRHVPSFVDLRGAPSGTLWECLSVVRAVAGYVRDRDGAASIITNEGDYQESKHLHWHVVHRGGAPEQPV